MTESTFLSETNIAALLGVSSRSVQRMVSRGDLPVIRVGSMPVFDVLAVATTLGIPPRALGRPLLSVEDALQVRSDLNREILEDLVRAGRISRLRIGRQERLVREQIEQVTLPAPDTSVSC